MKRLALAALLALSARASFATPYFREPGINGTLNLQTVASIDPTGKTAVETCDIVPLVYHSSSDGYLLIPGEDWVLVGAGGSFSIPGDPALDIGPSFNVLSPIVVEAFKIANKPVPTTITALGNSLEVGPAWEFHPTENKGYFKIQAGLAWKF